MSTMDYLEFKNYLEHGYEAAMHNKKRSQESVKRQDEVNQTIQRLKAAAIKDIRFYINDYNNGIESWRQKIIKAKEMLNSPAGTQSKSSYVKTNSGQASILEEIKVLEYTMNHEIEEKEALEKKLSEIVSDKTGKKAKGWVDAHKHELHHSSMAGMPSTIKRDQQAQIRKEIIKRIDAYENSANFRKIRSEGSALGGKFSASNNTNMRGGGYTAKSEMRRASGKGEAADYKSRDDAYNALLSYISKVTGSAAYSGTFSKEEMELISTLRKNHPGTAKDIASKLKDSLLSHDNLEHGWFTDLFKKSYNAKGSTAGMPTNLPRTATSGGSAGSKQLVYSDQLRKLNNNLVEYELKMNQAKASYEEYRKLYNDTKKNIANTEKALTEATKEAARTGFDPSKSSVSAPARRYASSNAILPQTTITGSTEGLKKTRYHVKKK